VIARQALTHEWQRGVGDVVATEQTHVPYRLRSERRQLQSELVQMPLCLDTDELAAHLVLGPGRLLQQDDAAASPCQQDGGRAAGNAAAYDGDVMDG